MKKIVMTLDPASINAAIKELEEYQSWVERKTKELAEALATAGGKEAMRRFSSANYDGDNDVYVTVEENGTGWVIRAQGNSVAFIEWGAGIRYNPREPHPNGRPPGIVGIGEWGYKQGSRRTKSGKPQPWGFYDDGNLVITYGHSAQMPMWFAGEEIRLNFESLVHKVFSSP